MVNFVRNGSGTTRRFTRLCRISTLLRVTAHDRILAHLERDYTQPVRDPLWKHIYLSEGLIRVIDSDRFQQLNRIKQLGPSYLVYPGATHTRLSHSLGVFHIARRMIRTLAMRSDCPPLSLEGVKAFLTASLVHDLGHFPYAHSLKELPLKDHEKLTGEQCLEGELRQRISDDVGTDPRIVAAIVDESIEVPERDEIALYRSILSGTLDPDKLDYLNRDAYYCGVPYGIQDLDFAVNRIVPMPDYRLALDVQGVSAVENILFSKYLMYRAVYWHRTVRVATAMIKRALYLALTEEIIRPEELYGLDDELFFARCRYDRFPAFRLIEDVASRRLYKVVSDRPFDSEIPEMVRLSDLSCRSAAEQSVADSLSRKLARRVDRTEVVIDIPEPVSFDISMPIVDEDGVVDYPNAGTVFTPQVIHDFTQTLRRIRVMLPGDIAGTFEGRAQEIARALKLPGC